MTPTPPSIQGKPSDQTLKLRAVYVTAALSLVGFVLEIGPVGGVFSLVNGGLPILSALSLELPVLGFLAYLSLAASAVVGLRALEAEPKPRETPPEQTTKTPSPPDAEAVTTRVRPELHQMRMIVTALGGYAVLKGASLVLMSRAGLEPAALTDAFEFGFYFTALSWFVLWQFLRWYAARHRWKRLEDELVGGNVGRFIALVILLKPVIFIVGAIARRQLLIGPLSLMTLLLHLALIAIAVILWFARPVTLRRTVVALGLAGGVIVLLTAALAYIERSAAG